MVLFDPNAHPREFCLIADESLLVREGIRQNDVLAIEAEDMYALTQFDTQSKQRPSSTDPMWLPDVTADFVARNMNAGREAMRSQCSKRGKVEVYWQYAQVCNRAIGQLVEHSLIQDPNAV